MFLDESGDHSLTVIDPQYPIFVLGGVITEQTYAEGQMSDEVRKLKLDLFGRDDICLHTSDITEKPERLRSDGGRAVSGEVLSRRECS